MKPLITVRLLAYPLFIIGSVQFLFGSLSLLLFRDHMSLAFMLPATISLLLALGLLLILRQEGEIKIGFRDSLAFVTLSWVVSASAAAIPIADIEHISFTDAMFESMSALTTTGATVLSNLDQKAPTFLLYRQFLQWLGGMGVVVFVVAIVPMLNIGGMRVFRAETPGPLKDEKLAPRVAHTSRYLWYIYVILTLLCALGYYLAGMNSFDAIAHSFTTVSTGGFSTHDASLGYFDNRWIELNADLFMILGAVSFALHFKFSRSFSLRVYLENEEARTFFWIIFVFIGILFALLYQADIGLSMQEKFLSAVFHLISFLTSTGYGAGNYPEWPLSAALFLIFAGYIGGCAGSTAGGNKIIRNLITAKVIGRQVKELLNPRGVFPIQYNHRTISRDISSSTMSYMVAAATLSVILTLAMQMTGLDFWTAFSAVAACLNVLGPAFGDAASGFQSITDTGTWILTFTMLLGRLEFYTVLALLSLYYWRG